MQVEDLLFERGIDICHETVRFWWNRFGPMFAAEIRKRRVRNNRCYSGLVTNSIALRITPNGACGQATVPAAWRHAVKA